MTIGAGERLERLWSALRLGTTFAAYVAIALVSLVPKDLRPSSGIMPGAAEHFAAYLVLGLVAAYGLRGRIDARNIAVANTVFAACLEAGQFIVPGRVPSIIDFAASTTGGWLGLGLGLGLASWLLAGRDRARKAP